MIPHRLVLVGALVAACLLVGCSDAAAPPQRGPTTALLAPAPTLEPPPPREEIAPATQPTPDTADLLARRAEAYALEVERQMNSRHAPPPSASRPSAVEWTQPGSATPVESTSGVPATGNPPAPTPAPLVPGGANQPAKVPETPVAPAPYPTPPANPIPAAPTPPPVPSPAAPPPATAPIADELSAAFARRIADNPRDIAAHLDYQLIRFLRDEPTPDLTALAPLPREDREMLAALMDGLGNFRSTVRSDLNMPLARKIRPLLEMDTRLRNQSELSIATLELCTKVESFGVYEPISPARFVAGREHPVIVYSEIENFASQFNDKKLWETRLTQESVLYTDSGLNVWSDKSTPIVDLSRHRRRDFFVVRLMKLPANLTLGQYFLKVTVIDQQASRVAEATLPIQVVAK